MIVKGAQFLKSIKLLCMLMSNEIKTIIFIMLEITVMVISFNIFWGVFCDYMYENIIYSGTEFNRAVVYSVQSGEDPKELVSEIKGVSYLNTNYSYSRGYIYIKEKNYNCTIISVGKEYLESIGVKVSEKYPGCAEGFFPKDVKNLFSKGKIYSFTVNGKLPVNIYVSEIINKKYMIFPPSGNNPSGIFSKSGDILMVYDPENTMELECTGGTILVDRESELEIKKKELTEKGGMYVKTSRESRESEWKIARSQMGLPIIFAIIIFFISLASFTGYNLITLIKKEKFFGVFYMCGSSWKKCMLIQLEKDIITLAVPIFLSFAVLYVLDQNRIGMTQLVTISGFLVSVGLCLLIFVCTSMLGLLKMKSKVPVEIIRRI